MSSVAVLNPPRDDVLHRVPVEHAIRMLVREVVEVVAVDGGRMFGPYRVPTVVRLVTPVDVSPSSDGVRVFSRLGVLERDHYRCAYCGRTGGTVDHVVPRSRGGASSWLNLVACCSRCNWVKADRTPREAGMELLFLPFDPNG